MEIDLDKITRVVVAGPGMRNTVEEWHVSAEIHIQDDGRTLKLFLHRDGS